MAISFDDMYKNKVGCRIIVRISQAIKDGELPEEEIKEICAYVLVAIQDIKSQDELVSFLAVISYRWPFLHDVTADETNRISTVANIENAFAERGVSPTTQ